MKKNIVLFLLLPLISLFAQGKQDLGKYYNEKEEKIILNIIDSQAKAWNEGSLEGYMDAFWRSESLRMVSKAGVQYGWDTTMKMYKESIKSKEDMGTLWLKAVKLDFLNKDVVFIIGRWEVDQKEKTGGHFVQLWKKIKGKWVITTDYTS
jgi:hypothetical protein